ncbi:hypothetical protein CFAM422_006088 [Trichoderma lentiforme]|uniref:NAD(P)-binding protein n=1 Tax=Trichoderma lentiforme TaxID=1567552 RepID=A0A9P4XFK9_9HYPO|nr:hypothetical protein CFAM422_006088 [Trichoderma lentiforme]
MPSYIIIGASRGLGYEWLRHLSRDSENIIVGLVRNPDAVEAKLASDSIRNVNIIKADLTDHKSLSAAVAKTADLTGGSVDYLIINGVHQDPAGDFLSPTEFIGREELLHDYMVKAMETNVVGVMYGINAYLPLVRKSSVKKITVISTGLADLELALQGNMSFFVTYSAVKAALNMVVAKYSIDLRADGVTIIALSPGLVNTQEAPPPAEIMPRIQIMMQDCLAVNPEFKGPIEPAESVKMQLKVIETTTIKQSGEFLSHFGNKQWI